MESPTPTAQPVPTSSNQVPPTEVLPPTETAFSPEPAVRQLNFDQKGSSAMNSQQKRFAIGLTLTAIVAGVLTGYGVFRLQNQSGSNLTGSNSGELVSAVAGDNLKEGDVFGSPREEDFVDSAQGYLEIGGINGEGSHKLLREGGSSQTVYLTSSVTDLSKFAGMEVQVWGETQKAQKAGWLMDVGRVKVIKIKGQQPATE